MLERGEVLREYITSCYVSYNVIRDEGREQTLLDIGGGTVARGPSVLEVLGKWLSSVQRGIRSRGRAIRLPVLTGDRVTKTHDLRAAMTALFERTPTPEELGERPGKYASCQVCKSPVQLRLLRFL